ncbi:MULTISPECIES: hypothetical protein [Rhodopseudomonas]|uniref:Uncharacterized protein n=1 Tax=Rhodopseudomonas palustris TaxID=1076 RepID=A0A0D7F628_RHOPL|nr:MULTISPECIES: hypothetical protein [Rhodopseudomonas]KIZ48226.1 hypothetical protein OO17_00090 [Rhodopseudomonas palustris]MDF3810286.1 hypothetical protein [Rhodopseudomonas sp. BAL398]WOK17171.1 hypothetical protein RBJ75_24105 [Rhodopseudomonas sp. BAL398]
MASHSADSEAFELMERMRAVITQSNMDGHCRDMLCSAFDRFLNLEARRLSKRFLHRARDQKQRIVATLALMAELDGLGEDEADRSVFAEMAQLFDEISLTAVAGSAALREMDRVKSEFAAEEPEKLETLMAQWSPQCAKDE